MLFSMLFFVAGTIGIFNNVFRLVLLMLFFDWCFCLFPPSPFRMAFSENGTEADDLFLGRSIMRVMILNDQTVKAVWKEEQLQKYIFPRLETGVSSARL